MCIVLGVDSYLNFMTLEWLDNNKQLANSYNRGAFFPGEGAGAVLIASNNTVSRHKLDSLAVIRGLARFNGNKDNQNRHRSAWEKV